MSNSTRGDLCSIIKAILQCSTHHTVYWGNGFSTFLEVEQQKLLFYECYQVNNSFYNSKIWCGLQFTWLHSYTWMFYKYTVTCQRCNCSLHIVNRWGVIYWTGPVRSGPVLSGAVHLTLLTWNVALRISSSDCAGCCFINIRLIDALLPRYVCARARRYCIK